MRRLGELSSVEGQFWGAAPLRQDQGPWSAIPALAWPAVLAIDGGMGLT
jgi:hypothetical protein